MHHDTERGNVSLETVEYFKYLGKTIANQSYIHEEIKGRLNSGNAFHSSLQQLLSSMCYGKYKDKNKQNYKCLRSYMGVKMVCHNEGGTTAERLRE